MDDVRISVASSTALGIARGIMKSAMAANNVEVGRLGPAQRASFAQTHAVVASNVFAGMVVALAQEDRALVAERLFTDAVDALQSLSHK